MIEALVTFLELALVFLILIGVCESLCHPPKKKSFNRLLLLLLLIGGGM